MLAETQQNSRMITCVYFPQGANTEKLAEVFLRLTPDLAVRPGDSLLLDFSRIKVWKEVPVKRIHVLLKKLNHSLYHLGLGAHACEAYARARLINEIGKEGESLPINQFPLKALSWFIDPFSDHWTTDADKLTHQFRSLGFKNLGQIKALPVDSLPSRFGFLGLELWRGLHGQLTAPWPIFRPAEVIQETRPTSDVETQNGPQSLDFLSFHLKSALDSISSRLHSRQLLAQELQLHFQGKDSRKIAVNFPIPQASSRSFLSVIREVLDRHFSSQPLTEAIDEISVVASVTTPSRSTQRHFFSPQDEGRENWGALIARMSARVGEENIFHAAWAHQHRPENAWRKISVQFPSNQQIMPALPRRPTRLLPQPVPLKRESVKSLKRRSGPERIQGDWWDNEYERDYFELETGTGERIWAFHDRKSGHLFLHGYFD